MKLNNKGWGLGVFLLFLGMFFLFLLLVASMADSFEEKFFDINYINFR